MTVSDAPVWTVESLIERAAHADDEVRAWAVSRLGHCAAPEASAALVRALSDASAPVVLEAVHASALVACLWHHVYHAAKRGLPLDDAVCRECSNLALKSLRDIVREHAAAAPSL